MLRNLLSEVVRRQLWPIPLVAVTVAVAAPVLFLKPSPPHGSAAPVDVSTAPAGHLPARAQRLLDTSDGAKTAARRPAGSPSDPFQAPSHGTAPAAPAAAKDTAGTTASTPAPAPAATSQKPVEVVITNSDGTPQTSTTATPPVAATDTGTESTTKPAATAATAVTTRFGKQFPGPVQHSIPRLQTFVSDGAIVAIFVKYSPARDKAVFAIAPSTVVTGDAVCRKKDGVCRYVDLAVGKHVRLGTRAADDTLVNNRLDVVRIDHAPQIGATAAADSAPANGSCLLNKLLTLTADDPPLPKDAC